VIDSSEAIPPKNHAKYFGHNSPAFAGVAPQNATRTMPPYVRQDHAQAMGGPSQIESGPLTRYIFLRSRGVFVASGAAGGCLYGRKKKSTFPGQKRCARMIAPRSEIIRFVHESQAGDHGLCV